MLKNSPTLSQPRHATQEVIELLYQARKQISAATQRDVDLGLNDDEVPFHAARYANDSAGQAMGSDERKVIAAELITQVRKSRSSRSRIWV